MKSRELKLLPPSGPVSALLDSPGKPMAGIALAHGAGAGMRHEFMAELACALVGAGFAVLRFQFPYMEAKQRRTDPPKVSAATVAAAVQALRAEVKVPVFAAGKSFGARMTTTAASLGLLEDVAGIICFGFPLHPAKQPSIERAAHLSKIDIPMLFLQGTRDDLADLELMRGVCKKLKLARLHVVEHADHGFGVLKRSGRTGAEVMAELVLEASKFRDR
ncbi:MAG TPA: alpha/beta family hydrolase [Bdellovibrionota bacterium]|nr:alpha/beta family hydrolase [Bdellovibrionota bacterium]